MYYAKELHLYKDNDTEIIDLVIPDEVTSICSGAFSKCINLKSVTIPNSVESIGRSAFEVCTGLKSIDIPNSVTSIGVRAFSGCTGLKSIDIPNSVTSIGGGAFSGCQRINTIKVANDNPIYDSRDNCNAIIEIASNTLIAGCMNTVIPYSVTSINSSAFSGCTGLTNITIPNSVTSIGNSAFYGCTSLTSIIIPNSVTSIDFWTFYGCTSLTNIIIPNSVTNIGSSAFYNTAWYNNQPNGLLYIGKVAYKYKGTMPSNTNITINEGTASITPSAFSGCKGLTSITIPNSVTSIGSSAFEGCVSLASITISNSVTSIGSVAFDDTPWYNNQPNGLLYIGKVAYKYKGTMPSNTNIIIKEGTVSITPSAFFGCKGLTSITIPNSVTSIGSSAFDDCVSLTSITIPNSVTSIGSYAFKGCSGLTYVTIPNSVTSIEGGVFWMCTRLTSIIIPNNVTSIGDQVFQGCSGLTSITIPNSVKSIGNQAFYGCTELKSYISKIRKPFKVDSRVFYNLPEDAELTVPYGTKNKYLKTEGWDVFKNINENNLQYYKLNITAIGRGSVINNNNTLRDETNSYTITEGSNVVFTFTPDKGYKIKNVKLNGADITLKIANNKYSINDIGADIVLEIEFEPITYALILMSTGYGTALYNEITVHDMSTSFTILEGTDAVVTFAPDEGHKIKSVKLNGIDITSIITNNQYTISNISADVTLEVEFEPETYVITYIVDGQTYKTASIKYGTTITPEAELKKEGYSFSGWSDIPETMPAYNVTVTGTFTINQYKLTYMIDGKEYKSYMIDYNSVLTPEVAPVKKGMTFSGWDNFPKNMPANNVTIRGSYSWSKKTQDNVIYQVTDTLNNYVSVIDNEVVNGKINIRSSVNIDGYSYIVNSIGDYAFYNCIGLTSVVIPESITNIANNAFYGCSNLNFVILESNSIVSKSYSSNNSLKNIFGVQVQQYIIGENVTSIGDYAFYGSNQLASIELPDNITQIGYNAIPNNVKLFVNKGTKTLLTCWNKNLIPYDKQTEMKLMAPALHVEDITQTKATVKILNTDLKDGYYYSINNEAVNNNNIKYTGLRPETTQQLKLVVSLDDVHYDVTDSYTTKGMNTKVDDDYKVTASSIRATGSYTEKDAKVVSQRMYILNQPTEGNECFASGLNPGRSYTVVNEIDVDYGGETTATYRASKNISPARLQFNVAQPKVVSKGNAIVSATVNLDPEEENIGFEWRRTDWTDEFPSNTGQAYLYEGVIEGYIKNLNTDKLWKFRPYYLSDDGTYHYGDWMGLDPTNTSYFEPTVHTYARINIEGNTALVRGYALAGTANIKVQGFMYWKTSQGSNASHQAPSIPSNAKTITAIGQQIITATLAALDYNSVYHYVAFVTTEDGTTYYGEEQVFTTPTAPAGVDDVIADAPANMKKGVYNLTGVKLADELSELQGLPQGVYIIDGKKIMVK